MITIIGPRDMKVPGAVDTTSHSSADWSTGLSPFSLGPVRLYGSRTARIFENAWQFAKLYPEHADANGQPHQPILDVGTKRMELNQAFPLSLR